MHVLDLRVSPVRWPRLEADVAFLCAAESSIERCEADPAGTQLINVQAPARLAHQLASAGAHVVLLSSSAVFDGTRTGYGTAEPTSATTVYGAQKAHLERDLSALPAVTIVRLSKVVAPQRGVFSQWASTLYAGGSVEAFEDAAIAPVSLAAAIELLSRVVEKGPSGLIHFSAKDEISYAQAARRIAVQLGRPAGAVTAVAAPGSARVARHGLLDSSSAQKRIGVVPPPAFAAFAPFKRPDRRTR